MLPSPPRLTAGELSKKASLDNTKYDALEVGHAMTEEIAKELLECRSLHNPIFNEDEYCICYVIAEDPLIANLKRRKFFASLYLPKPRPNQAVFLYNKRLDRFMKRLWVLPSAMVMAELAGTNVIVHKRYQTMQAWSVAFFKGTFWEYIRYEHDIKMPSEHEYFLKHRDELIEAGCKVPGLADAEPFDFSKVCSHKIVDPEKPLIIE